MAASFRAPATNTIGSHGTAVAVIETLHAVVVELEVLIGGRGVGCEVIDSAVCRRDYDGAIRRAAETAFVTSEHAACALLLDANRDFTFGSWALTRLETLDAARARAFVETHGDIGGTAARVRHRTRLALVVAAVGLTWAG